MTIRRFFTHLGILFLLAASIISACSSARQKPAVLNGGVSVGPLSPVEQSGVTPEPVPAEVYTSRGIHIYTEDGKTLVKEVTFNPDGSYSVELEPGTYRVDLIPNGIDLSKDLPQTVTLAAGETFTLDIDIDTGIR